MDITFIMVHRSIIFIFLEDYLDALPGSEEVNCHMERLSWSTLRMASRGSQQGSQSNNPAGTACCSQLRGSPHRVLVKPNPDGHSGCYSLVQPYARL